MSAGIGQLVRQIASVAAGARSAALRTLLPRLASINDYERRVTSQNGEDGIIAELFARAGTTDRFFVEFGVEDGTQCNSAQLALQAWPGLMIESDETCYRRLVRNCASWRNVRALRRTITADNIESIFAECGVPDDFDFLSIDVDGNDYWIWRALRRFRPRVAVIEYNASHAPPAKWVMAPNPAHRWDGTWYFGASLTSLARLSEEKGYSLVGTDRLGVNAFFVRADDVLARCGFPKLAPEAAYHPPRFIGSAGTMGHPPGSGPHLEI